MPEGSAEFDSLLTLARQGDRDALARLIEQYEPEVRLVARVRLGTALRPYLDSVDLVQSVHRSLMLGLREERFDISTPDRLVALAVTIVRRKVARHWRRLRRQCRLEGIAPSGESLPDLILALSASESDPTLLASIRDQVAVLFERLSEQEQRVMELRLEGYTTAEAARILGSDPDVLRVRLNRLRHRLRNCGIMSDWL